MTGFGLGFAPKASGTFGSAGAIAIAAIAWGVCQLAGGNPVATDAILVVLTLLASAGCVRWGPWAVAEYADKARKEGDPGQVVLDEFAGQWVSLFMIPMASFKMAVAVLAVQFFFFRLFDVLKPPPARQLEKLPFGWGILLDDVAAGVYANIVGQVIFRVFV